MTNLFDQLAQLSPAERDAEIAKLTPEQIIALRYDWSFLALPHQRPPPGNWRYWLMRSGRGAGKTIAGAQWVRGLTESGRGRSGLIVGPTVETTRKICIEGPSGILECCPPDNKPIFEPSSHRLVWGNGAQVHYLSSEEPDRIRGGNYDFAWLDELAAFANLTDTWTQVLMATRLTGPTGEPARIVITSTPRPLPLLKRIESDPACVVTEASTFSNPYLDDVAKNELRKQFEGTSLGAQELYGRYIGEADGALWTRSMLDACRVRPEDAPKDYKRIVVGVDPSGGVGNANAECGIIVAGVADDEHCYILDDRSARLMPHAWGQRVIAAYHDHRADRVCVEVNFGAAMVTNTLRSIDPFVPVREVSASRGKRVRAEPVSSLFQQRRCHLLGFFDALEEQLATWVPDESKVSPDRLDAMVWCVSELMLKPPKRYVERAGPPIAIYQR